MKRRIGMVLLVLGLMTYDACAQRRGNDVGHRNNQNERGNWNRNRGFNRNFRNNRNRLLFYSQQNQWRTQAIPVGFGIPLDDLNQRAFVRNGTYPFLDYETFRRMRSSVYRFDIANQIRSGKEKPSKRDF